MKPDAEGIMKIPEKGKIDFSEHFIKERLFTNGIDHRTINNERQLENILQNINDAEANKLKQEADRLGLNDPSKNKFMQKEGEVIKVDFGKPFKEEFADGGIAGLLGERPGYAPGGFLQLTPENISQARNMSWGQALKTEIPGSSTYKGFSPTYKGEGATGLGGYIKSGFQSLTGNVPTSGGVGGATPLTRKLALTAMDYAPKVLGIASKALGPLSFLFDTTAVADATLDSEQHKALIAKEALFKKKQEQANTFKQIKEKQLAEEAAAAAAAKAKADAAYKAKQQSTAGYGSAAGGKGFDAGTGRTTKSGYSGKRGRKEMMASGGRIGFSKGKLANLARRNFMKLLGGAAAGIGALKTGAFKLLGKEAAPIAKEVITTPAAAGKPAWFDALVTRVINEGDDVTKKFATKEREIVHATKIDEDAFVTVTRDLDSGTVRVDSDDVTTNVADEQGNAIVSMEVRGGQLEQGVKGKTPAEFEAVETDYGNYMDGPDDFITEAVENTVSDTKDLTADLTKVKMYAKGQKKPTIKEMMIQRERARDLKLAEENPAEYASGRQPDIDYSDYDNYASGGVARLLGE